MALRPVYPAALLLWPLLAALIVWLWRRRGAVRSGSSWLILALRLTLITLLTLALANPGGQAAANAQRLVVLVDRSASLDEAALAEVQRELANRFSSPEVLVVQFAEGQQWVANLAEDWPAAPGQDYTSDLESALNFAGQLLTGGSGSILLISDGRQTSGDALRAARALREADSRVRVDVLPLSAATHTPDVAVESIRLPPAIWAGEDIFVTVNLYSASPVTATVRLSRDDQTIGEREIALPEGATQFEFASPADVPGLSIFRAEITLPGDAIPQNNAASAVVHIQPAPKVLIAVHHPASGGLLQQALSQTGIEATVVEPSALPANFEELLRHQVLVLEDVSASSLSIEQWAAVQAFTQAYGRGLVVIGGRAAYTLGAYETTPLEAMLPVKLETPRRAERPPATLLLVIDNSGSMAPNNEFGPPKIDLAKEAAMRAVEILQPNDRVGVIGFSHQFRWAVPLGVLGQGLALRDVLDQINSMTARGGTNMLTPLQAGIRELAAQPTERKHLVLLSDGQTYRGDADDFEQVLAEASAAGITVSTIALGERGDAWQQLMASIAEWGQGRYHFAEEPEDIPRLLLGESQSVNSDPIQLGRTQFQVIPHPMVRGFGGDDLPPVEGYLALTPRPEADTVLTSSSFSDPVLAVWQFGLGRVVAWTSDVGGREAWTRAWANWEGFPRFWTQVVRYALPDPRQGTLAMEAVTLGREIEITVQATGDAGKGINLANGEVLFRGPDGAIAGVELPQTAPGEYAVTFTAPSKIGAYRALAVLEGARDNQRWEAPFGFVVDYSPEYRPQSGSGVELLTQIAEITGGRVLLDIKEVQPPRGSVAGVTGYAPWLILAALLLWPVDIALRRRFMPWPVKAGD